MGRLATHPPRAQPPVGAENEGIFTPRKSKVITKDTRTKLKKIQSDCDACKRNANMPRRLKLTLDTEYICFNRRVVVDTIFL